MDSLLNQNRFKLQVDWIQRTDWMQSDCNVDLKQELNSKVSCSISFSNSGIIWKHFEIFLALWYTELWVKAEKQIIQNAHKFNSPEVSEKFILFSTAKYIALWDWGKMSVYTFCTAFVYRNSAQGNEHEVYPTIQMRHAALERNKRCLLTYLYVC